MVEGFLLGASSCLSTIASAASSICWSTSVKILGAGLPDRFADVLTIGSTQALRLLAKGDTLSRTIDNTINYLNPVYQVFASIQENDTYMFKEAMQQMNNHRFVEAMMKELFDHDSRGH